MSWTSSVQIDTDQPDVGSAVVTWIDPALAVLERNFFTGIESSTPATFSYSRRVKVNTTDGAAFLAEAIAARDIWQTQMLNNQNAAAWILSTLGTTDPKKVKV